MILRYVAGMIGLMLLASNSQAEMQVPAFPWKAGDQPPAIAGVTLGISRERLQQLLGEPTKVQRLGEDGLALVFKPQGVTALWAPKDGVAIIYVETREAADIGGVRIGDSKSEILARWGKPSVVQGPTAIYRAGSWGVVIRIDETNHVVALSVGNLTP